MADETTPTTQTPQSEALEVPILAPEATPELQTAQPTPSEPLGSEPATEPELISTEISGEAKAEPEKEETEISEVEIPEAKPEVPAPQEFQTTTPPIPEPQEPQPTPPPQEATPLSVPAIIPPQNKIRELLTKARNAIQTRKRKKLEKIMTMFAKQTKITNDEVEKLLHVSDATATRYLTILKKENKIKQTGKTGKGVSYSKI